MEVGTKITLVGQTPLTNHIMTAIFSDFKGASLTSNSDLLQVTKAVQGLDRPV